jgi:hypothetical protein
MEPVVITVRKPFEYTLTPGETTTLSALETMLESLPDALNVEVDWKVDVEVDVVAVVPAVTFVCVPDAPFELSAEVDFD